MFGILKYMQSLFKYMSIIYYLSKKNKSVKNGNAKKVTLF